MGREIKRVPLDFDWPLRKVWDGFQNPHYKACPEPHCYNGGTAASELLDSVVHLILIAGESATQESLHPYLREIGCHRFDYIGPDAIELSTGLAGRAPSGFGHDACDRWSAIKKIRQAAGLPESWGVCPVCHGDAIDPAVKEQYEAWRETEPPTGEGWQVWETVSEGSPISPVFPTADELTEWLVGQGYSREASEQFVKSGWVPSMVMQGGELLSDIESARLQNRKE